MAMRGMRGPVSWAISLARSAQRWRLKTETAFSVMQAMLAMVAMAALGLGIRGCGCGCGVLPPASASSALSAGGANDGVGGEEGEGEGDAEAAGTTAGTAAPSHWQPRYYCAQQGHEEVGEHGEGVGVGAVLLHFLLCLQRVEIRRGVADSEDCLGLGDYGRKHVDANAADEAGVEAAGVVLDAAVAHEEGNDGRACCLGLGRACDCGAGAGSVGGRVGGGGFFCFCCCCGRGCYCCCCGFHDDNDTLPISAVPCVVLALGFLSCGCGVGLAFYGSFGGIWCGLCTNRFKQVCGILA